MLSTERIEKVLHQDLVFEDRKLNVTTGKDHLVMFFRNKIAQANKGISQFVASFLDTRHLVFLQLERLLEDCKNVSPNNFTWSQDIDMQHT